jgi:hypothetical protein
MKYSDLIQFEPIDEVIQLRQADEEGIARQLVETFVVSDRLAPQLNDLVIPQLQFDEQKNNKGLLIVGNYGTGKSHLMAVLSAVAERADLADRITNPDVAKNSGAIAGRFMVARIEIGAVVMPLRDIICAKLEEHLAAMDVHYTFKSSAEVTNNKDPFIEMMGVFQEKYPDMGLLLVVDELLDYLRGRKDQELVLDLGFLREIGEVCKISRFRFMAGVQESLFDNPRFQFVAESLRRVKDRFEQIRIAREDVAYVVAHRLLKKDSKQEGLIRAHLQQFAPLFGSMNERMDDFVRLFPVHPAYIDTFEQVYVAEKREVLKTLSRAIRGLIDDDVPEDQPGLIAYDSYWKNLTDNPSFRAVHEIKEVIDRSSVLESRIQSAYPNKSYKPVALRAIRALSVHRLTTSDIYAPIGPTAEELRDDLCLLLPIPEQDAAFLTTMIEKVLKDVITTASGQFISRNPENGQYHLDLKKDIDFDALISKRAESLEESELDRYYFDALRRLVLEDPAMPEYVTGYRIWEHEVEWRERRSERSGYLFFGSPNERSTAQPPREFYIYFLQPYAAPHFKDGKRPDEVFFRLKHPDEDFESALRLYAAAREQAATASGANKKIYEDKAQEHLRVLTRWLREKMQTAFEVTHAGQARSFAEVVKGKLRPGESDAVRDLINAAASTLLASHFEDRAPDYPHFIPLITRKSRPQAAQEALRWIGGGVKSKQGAAVLDALGLIEGEQLRPRESIYAQEVIKRLGEKGPGQVLNRSELLENEHGIEVWAPDRFRLEPEFLTVVLAALVYSGDIVINLPGRTLDAASTDQFTKLGIADLGQFKHVGPPKDLPLAPLQELFELLGLNKALLVTPGTREKAVAELGSEVANRVERVVEAQAVLQAGISLWGWPVLGEGEQAALSERLASAKRFLESLQPFNTVGKLKNFPHDVATVAQHRGALAAAKEVQELNRLVEQVRPLAGYLETAEAVLPAAHAWVQEVKQERSELLGRLSDSQQRSDAAFARTLTQRMTELKDGYREAYLALHGAARLGAAEDKRKDNLNKDRRVHQLRALRGVVQMGSKLSEWEDGLLALRTCFSLSKQDLEKTPTCPHCGYRPAEEPPPGAPPSSVLDRLDDQLDDMVGDWTAALHSDLEDPTVQESLNLLGDDEGAKEIQTLQSTRELPDLVKPEFVRALQVVLSGLEPVPIGRDDLFRALADGGPRVTVDELRQRFDAYVAQLTRGKKPDKIRIVLE